MTPGGRDWIDSAIAPLMIAGMPSLFGGAALPQLSRLFAPLPRELDLPASIAIDVAEYETKYEIHAEVPGVSKADLRVEVDESSWPRWLTITAHKTVGGQEAKGEGQEAKGAKGEGGQAAEKSKEALPMSDVETQPRSAANALPTMWHRNERVEGTVERSIAVPDDADVSHITARYSDGVLTCVLPKSEVAAQHGRHSVSIE